METFHRTRQRFWSSKPASREKLAVAQGSLSPSSNSENKKERWDLSKLMRAIERAKFEATPI
jgi:hypothetical protein